MRCQAFIRLGHFEKALADSNKALELNPSDQYNWHNKCQALLGLGKVEEANQVIQEGVEKTGNETIKKSSENAQKNLEKINQAQVKLPNWYTSWVMAQSDDAVDKRSPEFVF